MLTSTAHIHNSQWNRRAVAHVAGTSPNLCHPKPCANASHAALHTLQCPTAGPCASRSSNACARSCAAHTPAVAQNLLHTRVSSYVNCLSSCSSALVAAAGKLAAHSCCTQPLLVPPPPQLPLLPLLLLAAAPRLLPARQLHVLWRHHALQQLRPVWVLRPPCVQPAPLELLNVGRVDAGPRSRRSRRRGCGRGAAAAAGHACRQWMRTCEAAAQLLLLPSSIRPLQRVIAVACTRAGAVAAAADQMAYYSAMHACDAW